MADALASGASVRKDVGVQVPPRALIALLSTYIDLGNNQRNFFTGCFRFWNSL